MRSQPQKGIDDNASALLLKTQLEAACDGLWWSSESDYPVEVVWQSGAAGQNAVDQTTVRKLANLPENIPIQVADVEDFFERQITPQSWHTAEDKSQLAQLRALKVLLISALPDLQVYRCGNVEIKVYAVGSATDGSIAGVKTTLVET